MQNYARTILIVLLLLLCSFSLSAEAEGGFVLPASLEIIDDEAFAGTAADSVVLQEKVEYIGDYAFFEMEKLRTIYIPESVRYIGDHAFDGTSDLTIYGVSGSYAEDWAAEHQKPFQCQMLWISNSTGNHPAPKLESHIGKGEQNQQMKPDPARALLDTDPSMRVTERIELHALDYSFP